MTATVYSIHQGTPVEHIPSKTCTICKQYKTVDEFYRTRSECKLCFKARSKKRYQQTRSNNDNNNRVSANMNMLAKNKMFDPKRINQILCAHEHSELKTAFLDMLKYVVGSSTGYNIKEEIVANVLDLNHCKDVNGPDAYSTQGEPWEIKTNFVAVNGTNTIKAGGSFNDITAEKLLEIPKYKMAVGIFVDHYLLAIGTFPGSWPPFLSKLEDQYQKAKNRGGRVCSSFHYNDWKDCPDLEWAVLPDIKSLMLFKDKLTKRMFDDLVEACTCAMEQQHSQLTSRSERANILGLN
jgi:hypothetical protein